MPETTDILALPYIQPNQAQKHVTHNEALRLLDAVVQLSVLAHEDTTPPGAPAFGDRYIVAPGGTGDWAGHDGEVAVYSEDGWYFAPPAQGWQAWSVAESAFVIFNGATWNVPAGGGGGGGLGPGDLQNLPQVGVNATADTTTRLSVTAESTLLNQETGSHRLSINKAAAGDVSSLVFQSGFTGHAELGLAGSNDLAFRVSADGTTFFDGLSIDNASGEVEFPNGLRLNGGTNLFDTYEEGSWTPVLEFGGASTGITYDLQEGHYVRIGRYVMMQAGIRLTSKGTATGTAWIAGLPFEPNPATFPGDIVFIDGGSNIKNPKVRSSAGQLIRMFSASQTGTTDMDDTQFTNTANFKITMSMLV